MKLIQTSGFLLVSGSLLLVGCGGSSNEQVGEFSTGQMGEFSLNVTDAPVDGATAVVVEFSGVTLKPAGGSAIEFIFDVPKSIDLLALQGMDSQPLLDGVEIPAGQYNQVRLHVNAEHDGTLDSYVEFSGGAKKELEVPSGSQSGLKINRSFTVAAGSDNISIGNKESIYTIDFDLRKSIVDNNKAAGLKLKPTLRMVHNNETGSISGIIDAALLTDSDGDDNFNCDGDLTTGNAVYVYSGAGATVDDVGSASEPLATALVKLNTGSGDYEYEFGYLNAGEYTLAFTCMADQDYDADDANDGDNNPDDDIVFVGKVDVAVEAGIETERDF